MWPCQAVERNVQIKVVFRKSDCGAGDSRQFNFDQRQRQGEKDTAIWGRLTLLPDDEKKNQGRKVSFFQKKLNIRGNSDHSTDWRPSNTAHPRVLLLIRIEVNIAAFLFAKLWRNDETYDTFKKAQGKANWSSALNAYEGCWRDF